MFNANGQGKNEVQASNVASAPTSIMQFEFGVLTKQQLDSLLNTLPVEITFIDENDFFGARDSEGEYLGAMEVVQDDTDIQKLQGEKWLLT